VTGLGDVESAPAGSDSARSESSQVIEVEVAGAPQPWRLELGGATDALAVEGSRRWARLGDQLLEIDAAAIEEPLAKSATEWRSHAWSSIQVFKVDDVRFELGEESLSIRRELGDWLRTTGESADVKVDFAAASDALYPLTELRATDLLERDTAEAAGHLTGEPQLTITLIASDGAEEHLELYDLQGDTAAATTAGRDAVLLLAAEDAQSVLDKVEALRAAEPYQPEP